MQKQIFLILLLSGQGAWAQEHDTAASASKFAQAKARVMEMMDKRISHLQEMRSCLEKASDRDQLQKCRQTFQQNREQMQSGMRQKWLEERKERRQDKKSAGKDKD